MSTALILGAGVSGTSAARLLDSREVGVRFFDDRASVVERLVSGGMRADGAPWSDAMLDGVDLVVVSPGWAPGTEPIVAAQERGLAIVSEIELAIPDLDCPLVAVTGTNGKTTVTELIASMGEAAGMVVVAAGNIGRPLTDVVGERVDAIALEMSSFQLYWTESLCPTVAVVLNVAADHLDWHMGLDAYRDAKAKIFALQDGSDVLVFDVDDDGAVSLVKEAASRRIPISGRHLPVDGYGVDENALVLPGGSVPIENLNVSDATFLADLVAAAAAAHEIGVSHEAIAKAAAEFVPSAHRRTLVG
ncbi:MAG TPA: UDP-N-acetylmuramoyl-L-alanine--D-glutamate ligase, partial [Actinobacteria bacterium]|nr:UDP-N-acetylmuramoyl-L-alanine--D-glutamate ligase [Actinomycetota bacterium]